MINLTVKALGGQLASLNEVVASSDFIVISLALNEETKFIINRQRIATMKSNAVLINIGRGRKYYVLHLKVMKYLLRLSYCFVKIV